MNFKLILNSLHCNIVVAFDKTKYLDSQNEVYTSHYYQRICIHTVLPRIYKILHTFVYIFIYSYVQYLHIWKCHFKKFLIADKRINSDALKINNIFPFFLFGSRVA